MFERISLAVPTVAMLLVAAVPAQLPSVSELQAARLQLRAWDATTGLPQNTVTALWFDRQGMLWAGTFGGLCRHDGYTWRAETARDSGLLDQRILTLGEDAAGNLLVGTERSTVYVRRGQRFEVLAQLPGSNLRVVHTLADGRVLCSDSSGWYEVREAGVLARLGPSTLNEGRAVLEMPGGRAFLVGRSGIAELRGDTVRDVAALPCTAAKATAAGVAYVGTDERLLRFDGEALHDVEFAVNGDAAARAVLAICEGRDGAVWYGRGNEICRLPTGGERPALVLPGSHRVRAMACDPSGGMWIGLQGGGLQRLGEAEVGLHLVAAPGGGAPEPHSLARDGEGRWLLGTENGLYRLEDGRFEFDPRLDERPIGGLLREDDGALWAGLDGGIALLRDAAVQTFEFAGNSRVRALHRDATGRLWCGTGDGVLWFEDGVFVSPPPDVAMAGETIKLIVTAQDGELWLASDRSLLRVDGDLAVRARLRSGEELPPGEVRAVLPRADGRVWLGCYGGGFVLLDGARRVRVGAEQGLFDPFVCSVVPLGDRWVVGSNRGTFLVDPRELDDLVDGRLRQVFSRPLIGPRGAAAEANGGVQPSALAAGEVVMICGVRGVLEVDVAQLQGWPRPLRCVFHRVSAGGRVLPASELQHVELAASLERVLTVEVTSPQFGAPELGRYRWRLSPVQQQWTEPSRERQFSFGIDAPGRYTLAVQACAVDGQFGPENELSIEVLPRLSERTSLQVTAVLLLLALVVLALRFGGRRAVRRARLLQRLVDERTVELRSLHDQLEARVAARTTELRSALEQLAIDHDKRLQLERELQQFQRMESLGALAGGVAHDFNNLLTVVLGNASLLEGGLSNDAELLELCQRIRQAAEQGRRMTRHLLTVASKQSVAPTVLDLGALLEEQRPVLRELLGTAVRLDLQLPGEPLPVRAAKSQLEQVLSNLCVNARDALPGGGRVCIACARAGSGVELRVQDDGVGMDDEVRRRAFEPFFSTKRVGRGTGLGLATVYGIVKQLGGRITVDSTPGAGATFVVWLPPLEEQTVTIPGAARADVSSAATTRPPGPQR